MKIQKQKKTKTEKPKMEKPTKKKTNQNGNISAQTHQNSTKLET